MRPPAAQKIVSTVPFQRWHDLAGDYSALFYQTGSGEFLVRFPGVADFGLSPTRGVSCTPALGLRDDAWRGIYEQQVQPLLLSLRGEHVFHGGAVVVGDNAIAFLAPSGRGKSTLTTSFARRGHAFLSDDCLHLDLAGPRTHVHAHAKHVRLWEDSASALGDGAATYVPGSPKPRLMASDQLPHCDQPMPLSRVYLLGEEAVDAPVIRPVSPSQQLIGWTANAFVLDIKNPDVLRRNLAAAARLVVGVGFFLWGMSLALAFSLITLVLLRLALHKLPDTDFAATSWLPLGPLATGCLGLLTMGQAAPAAFTGTPLAAAAELAHGIGLVGGLALWGAGLWWLVIATLFTRHYIRDNMAFNLGWWGFTFPLGVFALATLELLRLTELSFFALVGLVLSVQLAAIWLLVLQRTLRGVWHGELFQAPCLGGPQSAAHGVFSAD